MRNFIILLGLALALSVGAQDYGTAILFDSEESFGKYDKMLLNSFKATYDKNDPVYTEFYTWDGKSVPVPYEPFAQENVGDKPITKAGYLNANFSFDSSLKFDYKLDTLEKVTNMYAYYPISIAPQLKVVDLPTSEVLTTYNYDTKEWGVSKMYEIKDFKKYFGSSPNKSESSKSKTWYANLKKFKEAELDKITKWNEDRINTFGKNLDQVSSRFKGYLDTRLYSVIDFTYSEKGKLEEFYIDAKSSENVSKGDVFEIYQQASFQDFKSYDRVSLVTVQSVEADRALVKPFSLSKKKIAEALESGDKIAFARSEQLIRQSNKGEKPTKRVQVKGECFMCNVYLESLIVNISTTKLIERNFDVVRKYFSSKYTDERFIDLNMSEIQDKQEGIEYLFESTSAGMKATDIETGRIATVNEKEGGMLKGMFSSNRAELINLVMDIMDENIQVVEILKEKKGKLDKFIGYNPLGYESVSTYLIFRVIEEEVGGRTLEREEEIGKCYVGKRLTDTLVEIKVAKGEKELYSAMQAGDKIRYRVK